MDLGLSSKTVLISGGTSGIGLEAAREFLQEGARVCLMGRSEERGHAAVRLLQHEAHSADACFVAGDVRSKDDCSRVVRETAERFGGLDVLVNCAGMAQSDAFEDITPARFDEIMTLNCRTPFFLCQKALPLLRQSQAASILNIASVTAHKGYVRQAAYAASKHAMAGFTKTLAAEVYEQGIRVHLISPGGVFTDMAKVSRPDLTGEEMITAEDIAEIAAFLVLRRTNAVIDEIEVHRANKAPFA